MSAALTKHCKEIYRLLSESAQTEKVQGQKLLVFRGKLYETFRKSSVGQGYYTPVFRSLEDVGSGG